MKKYVKIIVIAVIALGVAGAVAVSSLTPLTVKTVTVVPEEAYAYFIEDGTVTGGADFMLYPEVSGAVVEVLREKGDYVEAGDVLVEIDRSEYERQVALHEANINGYTAQIEAARQSEANAKDEYRAAIGTLSAQLSQIEAQRKSAEATRLAEPSVSERLRLLQLTIDEIETDIELSREKVEKYELLFSRGALSQAELDDAKNALNASKALLTQYETEYEQVQGKQEAGDLAQIGSEEFFNSQRQEVSEQINALNQNIEKNLSGATESYYNALIEAEMETIAAIKEKIEKCSLVTPVSGYISELAAEGLSAVSVQSCVAIIKTGGEMEIESYVSTKDIGAITEGGEAALVLKGRDTDTIFPGTIKSISQWAETKQSALGLDEKKVRVVVAAMEPGTGLLPGYGLDVRYTVYREPDKLLVPTGALFEADGKDYVFTIKEGRAVKTPVVKGVKTLTETVIESGLISGDVVISEANTAELKEGVRVKAE